MQVDLIRCPISKTNVPNRNIIFQPITATTNLLQLDHAILTTDQWTLLSNLISNYEENQLLLIAQQIRNKYHGLQSIETIDSTIPEEFFWKIYELSRAYICSNGNFCTLSSDDRSAFLRNIAENVTYLGMGLCWSRSQIYNCQPFIQIYINFYAQIIVKYVNDIQSLTEQTDLTFVLDDFERIDESKN